MNDAPTPRVDAIVPTQGRKRTMLEYIEELEALARQLERELRWQRDYWESVPSGADYEADEDDDCPDDTVAHMAGIAIRRIDKLLEP